MGVVSGISGFRRPNSEYEIDLAALVPAMPGHAVVLL